MLKIKIKKKIKITTSKRFCLIFLFTYEFIFGYNQYFVKYLKPY